MYGSTDWQLALSWVPITLSRRGEVQEAHGSFSGASCVPLAHPTARERVQWDTEVLKVTESGPERRSLLKPKQEVRIPRILQQRQGWYKALQCDFGQGITVENQSVAPRPDLCLALRLHN